MKLEQEPKYDVNSQGQLINRATGLAIPDDEPVFVLRARDIHAIRTLSFYYAFCENKPHRGIVMQRIVDFRDFAENHPERMKEPDSPA